MKKTMLLFVLVVALTATLSARVIKVDINGSGQFTSINTAIINSVAGDTIKVLPGSYFEQVTINKNVVVMGSGYESTIINSNSDPTINMSIGKLQWFMISSTGGDGVYLTGGLVTNCVIIGCSGFGIYNHTSTSSASVINCIVMNNVIHGICADNSSTLNVTNCISINNGYNKQGFCNNYSGWGTLNLSYSDGSQNNTAGNQGCINQDPKFTSPSTTDFHISEGSPCWNSGNPALKDPDGSVSDMGYFGGPDCPVYPVVTNIKIIPQLDGSIQIQATGVANY